MPLAQRLCVGCERRLQKEGRQFSLGWLWLTVPAFVKTDTIATTCVTQTGAGTCSMFSFHHWHQAGRQGGLPQLQTYEKVATSDH